MKLDKIVRVKAHSKPYVLKGVKNKVYVLIEIQSDPLPKSKDENENKTPFDLCVVLDRSGSMNGKPLENSKKAVCSIINKMKQEDVLHCVVYDSDVDTIFSNGTKKMKQALIESVNNIQSKGCTNLMAGIDRGFKLLSARTESKRKRIMLFSDGLVNEGERNKSVIVSNIQRMQQKGVNVTSFGLGDSFDEPLMKEIAEYGHGDYFFIDGAKDIENKVSKGMKVITSLIGKNSTLKVRGKNGAIVTKVYGYDDKLLLSGIKLHDICEDDLRTVLLEVEIKPDDVKNDSVVEFLDFSYVFEEMKKSYEVKIDGKLEMKVTDNDKDAMLMNDQVKVALVIAQSGANDKKVLSLLESEEYDKAIELKKKFITKLEDVEKLDKNGLVKLILNRAKETLGKMVERKDVELVKKDVSYESHQCTIVHRKCF